ncbi:alkaline phosphatase D [Andreprevotia lacus DSM 23236]|jgi:alkaline phosphatase D|uniref:Alkaline phosphatase D n=1 Tax=Andreprevotia lacus DSM 23236 TaxID=1121001 RepID=A0A1W1X7F3_9NEIS|nr:alkaline phosphatase D family protein [Andreprevotia lacus]SMC19760.1 alkaline phosphatase D [Andreprevotia lacus DSM 23236]
MDRRGFLKLTGFITVSSLGGMLAACSSGGSDGTTPDNNSKPALFQFPQGIASGDPRPDSVLFWTRVLPQGSDPIAVSSGADIAVKLIITSSDASGQIGKTDALIGATTEVALSALTAWDHTLRHKITGLAPATTYYYQFVAGDSRSPVGRTRTAPASDAEVARLKFAFLSCQDWSINHWGAFDLLAADDLDFIVHLGDYIYETVGESFQNGSVESRHGKLSLPDGPYKSGNSGARYASTLADYRALYKQYRSDPRLQAVHARFPLIATWDDHEFSDDCWGDATTYTNGTYNAATGVGDNDHDTARRRSANQAWFEFMPADVTFDASNPAFTNIKLYRDFRFGKLAHLVMTDERLYRADHVIPEAAVGSSIGSRYLVPAATLAAIEGKKIAAATAAGLDPLSPVTMLGQTQRNWWQQTMQQSPATWKFWGNEVSLLRMRLDGSTIPGAPAALKTEFVLNADQWDGYNAERKNLVGFLRNQSIRNVVALTGDIHSFYAGSVYDDYSTGAATMVDLVTAGISSDSFYSYFASSTSDPTFAAAAPLVVISEQKAEAIAIQMLSAAIAMAAGVTDLSNTSAIQQAVGAAIAAGKVPAAAFVATASLSAAPINSFNDTVGGTMGATIATTIAALAAASRSVAAMTLAGLIQQQLAAALKIPAANVPASEVAKRLNPFANSQTGVAPVNNPWIKYADTDAQGYAVVTVLPGELQVEFRKVARLSNGQAPSPALQQTTRLRVPVNQPSVELL